MTGVEILKRRQICRPFFRFFWFLSLFSPSALSFRERGPLEERPRRPVPLTCHLRLCALHLPLDGFARIEKALNVLSRTCGWTIPRGPSVGRIGSGSPLRSFLLFPSLITPPTESFYPFLPLLPPPLALPLLAIRNFSLSCPFFPLLQSFLARLDAP